MPIVTKSLREYLLGNLNDFADSCSIPGLATPATLTGLVVTLANLREEGAILTPEIYLCESLEQTLQLLPVKETLQIGEQDDPSEAIANAVKKCGPLAIEGWCVYVTKNLSKYQFGLFRGSLNPSSISVEQTLFSESRSTIKLVRIFRTASGCVELRNHAGEIYSMLLSDKSAVSPLPQAYITALVRLVCSELLDPLRESTTTYMEKTFRSALNACHGTIIAVVKTRAVPSYLSDGVVLQAPLDIAAAVARHLSETMDTSAEHALNATTALLKGMISSDGITVFNKKGCLVAYNCFVSSRDKVAGKFVIGGARARAYEALRPRVGKTLDGVFIQSQDGWTNFTGASDEQ